MEFSKRQNEIIETSIQIISQEGIEALTTKNISGKIGISEAALYRHFDSKAGILLGILTFFEQRAKELLENVKNRKGPIVNIYDILLARCKDFMNNPAMIVIILSEEIFPQDSRLSEKVNEIMNLNQVKIQQLIEDGLNSGEIRRDLKKEELFYMIIGPFRFIVTRWRLSRFEFNLEEEFIKFWRTLEKLILIKNVEQKVEL